MKLTIEEEILIDEADKMNKETPFRIALMPQGDEKWIAGAIYICNLIRALKALPIEERPEFFLIQNENISLVNDEDFLEDLPAIKYYAYRKRQSFLKKARLVVWSLLRLRYPRSLENICADIRADAVFPVQFSLGPQFPSPIIGWIPDFQHRRLPHYFPDQERSLRDQNFLKLTKRCRHIVVSSQDAYKDLMRWFPMDERKVSILQFRTVGSPGWYQSNPQDVADEFGLPGKYLIFPSQFWIHKNHMTLFEAIRIVKDKGISDIALVLTGNQHDFRHPEYFQSLKEYIQLRELESNIYFLGLLPRVKQIQLTRQAAAVVQPSLFEGWSSLVEDCRTLGKTIYLSDIPVHREQHPPFSNFFVQDNPQQLADLIIRDWKTLILGPDLKRENQAREESRIQAVEFARNFLDVVEAASCIVK